MPFKVKELDVPGMPQDGKIPARTVEAPEIKQRRIGAHDYAGSGLDDVGEVIPRVG